MTEALGQDEVEGLKWTRAYAVRPKISAMHAYVDIFRLLKEGRVDCPLFFVGVDGIDYLIFSGGNSSSEEVIERVGEVLSRYKARPSDVDKHPMVEHQLDFRYQQYRVTGNPMNLSFAYES